MGQIRDLRVRAGLRGAEPTMEANDSAPTCEPATEGTCGDVCKLTRDICANQTRICEIAESETDEWFEAQCTSAKASCAEAKVRCCNCEA